MPRGFFISLDGLDGCGKSTQCQLLAKWLHGRGREVAACADPGGTAVGQVIRELLLGHRHEMAVACEALLFMASRAQLVAEVFRPALDAGQVVVSDRFILANVVYQGHAGGLDPNKLWEIGRFSCGGIEPDLTIVLDLTVEAALARRQGPPDRMESKGAVFQTKIREGYLWEARQRPDKIAVVPANQPVEDVHRQITQLLESRLLR